VLACLHKCQPIQGLPPSSTAVLICLPAYLPAHCLQPCAAACCFARAPACLTNCLPAWLPASTAQSLARAACMHAGKVPAGVLMCCLPAHTPACLPVERTACLPACLCCALACLPMYLPVCLTNCLPGCLPAITCPASAPHLQPLSRCAQQCLDQSGLAQAAVTNHQHLHTKTAHSAYELCQQAVSIQQLRLQSGFPCHQPPAPAHRSQVKHKATMLLCDATCVLIQCKLQAWVVGMGYPAHGRVIHDVSCSTGFSTNKVPACCRSIIASQGCCMHQRRNHQAWV
jgi:hypothetical protein